MVIIAKSGGLSLAILTARCPHDHDHDGGGVGVVGDDGGADQSKPRGDPASNGALLANAFSSGIGVMVGISSSSLSLVGVFLTVFMLFPHSQDYHHNILHHNPDSCYHHH